MNNFRNSLYSDTTATNTASKPIYKCSVCGKIHESIMNRAQCEIACCKKEEEAAKKAAETKKKLEQAKRKKEVDDAVVKTQELIAHYMKDYGNYQYMSDDSFEDSFFCELLRLLP